jgi:cytidine deaminase
MNESCRFQFRYSRLRGKEELSPNEKELVDRAIAALSSSYSPYSHFRVGAAVLLENGEIIAGSNQENGAYPSGLCAERVALFYAGARFPGVPVVSMAVVASSGSGITENPVTPCGACRQVMSEYRATSGKPFAILMVGGNEIVRVDDVEQLLPFSFSLSDGSKRK